MRHLGSRSALVVLSCVLVSTAPAQLAAWAASPPNAPSGPESVGNGAQVTTYLGNYFPEGITDGPDGALWFTNYGDNSIGRITTSGVTTDFTGTGIDEPTDITTGPDGALWFTSKSGPSRPSVAMNTPPPSASGKSAAVAAPKIEASGKKRLATAADVL